MSEQHVTSLWRHDTVNQRVTMATIAQSVADKYGLTVADLKGKEVSRKYAWPRQEAMYRMSLIGKSTPQIGAFLGGRDHTTIVYGIRSHLGRVG